MAASFNRVILVGNLTRNPELRSTPSGTSVCEIGVAVNDRRKTASGDWTEETTFVDVTFFGRTAEVVSEYLTKGAPLLIEGRLKLDSWENSEGQKRSKLRVIGERMQFLSGPRGAGGGGGGGQQRAPSRGDDFGSQETYGGDFDDSGPGDDVPF